MRKSVFLIIAILLHLPLFSQSIRQIRSDTSVIYAEGTGATPEESETVAMEELLLKLSRTNIIEGDPERVLKIWKTYASEVRALGSVIFEGRSAARYIKWSMVEKVFDSRRKTVSDLLEGASGAIKQGKPALARTYLDWAKIYLQTLPRSESESVRLKKLGIDAGEGDRSQVNMKHIVRETAEIQKIFGSSQDKKVEAPIIKEESRPIVKSAEAIKPERQSPSLESVKTPVGGALYNNTGGIALEHNQPPAVPEPIYSSAEVPEKFSAYIRTALANPFGMGAMAIYRFEDFGVYASQLKSLTSASSSYDCKSDGTTSFGYFWASGKEKKSAMALSAGAVMRLSGSLEAFVGGGYGSASLYWEDTSAQWAKVTDKSHKGAFCEAGIIVNIGRVSVIGGIGTVAFKTFAPIAGIGINIF